jgi:hypothetical protein
MTAAPNPPAAPKQAGSKHRNVTIQLGLLGPEAIRAMAEKTVAQTREMFETFGAAGQGAAALNRKIIDLALRNVVSGFELARKLAGANNLAEVVDLQVAYWQKQLALPAQAEEVRMLASRVSANMVRPTKAHATAHATRRTKDRVTHDVNAVSLLKANLKEETSAAKKPIALAQSKASRKASGRRTTAQRITAKTRTGTIVKRGSKR